MCLYSARLIEIARRDLHVSKVRADANLVNMLSLDMEYLFKVKSAHLLKSFGNYEFEADAGKEPCIFIGNVALVGIVDSTKTHFF